VNHRRVIVALDYDSEAAALALVDRLDPHGCRLKVGKELFTIAGPRLVEALVARGFGVFLDLKFHDIPNTVEKACKAAAKLGVWMMNVHASGGEAMLRAARAAIDASANRPLLIGVTVLTSLTDGDLHAIGLAGPTRTAVLRLAHLAHRCGLDGVVCSGEEAALLKSELGHAFKLVTPGIRPAGADHADQARVLTPERALQLGADYLVVGRPITQAPDPVAALGTINDSITAFLAGQQ
jgi:orotidine-5'-phosphate decarboxylase